MRKRLERRNEPGSTTDAKLLLRIASGEVDVHELDDGLAGRRKPAKGRCKLGKHEES